MFLITSHNSLCMSAWNRCARIGLNSALIVGCLRVFLAALSKVFRKAWLSLMKEQFARLAKSSLCSKRFCAVYEQRTRNESQLPREKWRKWNSGEGVGRKGRKRLQTNPEILKTTHLVCHTWVRAPTFHAVISCHNWPIKCLVVFDLIIRSHPSAEKEPIHCLFASV